MTGLIKEERKKELRKLVDDNIADCEVILPLLKNDEEIKFAAKRLKEINAALVIFSPQLAGKNQNTMAEVINAAFFSKD